MAASTLITWVARFRATGDLRPGQMGGHKPKKISGDHRTWLLERCRAADFTLRGLGLQTCSPAGEFAIEQ